jgi:hypothetical protein
MGELVDNREMADMRPFWCDDENVNVIGELLRSRESAIVWLEIGD